MLVASCGSDEDKGAALRKTDGFCDRYLPTMDALFNAEEPAEDLSDAELVEFNKTSYAAQSAAWNELIEVTPSNARAGAKPLTDALAEIATTGDDSFIDNGMVAFDYLGAVHAVAHENCGYEQVAVTLKDYAFEGIPATVKAGTVSFRVDNTSDKEQHEMLLLRYNDGVATPIDELLAQGDAAFASVNFAGIAGASAGKQSGFVGELTPGHYAVVCFLPVDGNEDNAPHAMQGMTKEFDVT